MTNNILQARVAIQGTRPLLFHHFGPDAIPLEKQEKTGVAGHDPEEWRRTCLVTKDGQLFLPPTYIFGCMRDGSKYTKKGRGSIQKSVVATLQVTSDRVLIDRFFPGFPNGQAFDAKTAEPPPNDGDLPVFMDIQSVRNPSTKGRNIRYRIAASKGWQCSFEIMWDKTIVSRNEIESVLIDSGRLVGLGDGRSIGLGRFDIESFQVEESA